MVNKRCRFSSKNIII